MFSSRQLNSKINKINKRGLRIANKDYESTFETLLARDKSVTVRTKNLQTLMTEIFKTGIFWTPILWIRYLDSKKNL